MGRPTTMCAPEAVLVVGLEMHSRQGSQQRVHVSNMKQGEVPESVRSAGTSANSWLVAFGLDSPMNT